MPLGSSLEPPGKVVLVTGSAGVIMQEEEVVGSGKTEHHVLCWVRDKEAAGV